MEKVKVIKIGNKSLVPIDKITSIAVHSKHIILYSSWGPAPKIKFDDERERDEFIEKYFDIVDEYRG